MPEEKIWFTADTHFFHSNILRYCFRPFSSIEEHDEKLIENWNSVVGKNDKVYHLGDVAFHKNVQQTQELMRRLNGQKFLCLGNHDSGLRKTKGGFGFVAIQDVIELKMGDQKVFLSHYAHRVWPSKHHGSYMLYGHSHNCLPEDDSLSFDVGVDCWNYFPISWETVQEKMKRKTNEQAVKKLEARI